jgi:hypothetical protein
MSKLPKKITIGAPKGMKAIRSVKLKTEYDKIKNKPSSVFFSGVDEIADDDNVVNAKQVDTPAKTDTNISSTISPSIDKLLTSKLTSYYGQSLKNKTVTVISSDHIAATLTPLVKHINNITAKDDYEKIYTSLKQDIIFIDLMGYSDVSDDDVKNTNHIPNTHISIDSFISGYVSYLCEMIVMRLPNLTDTKKLASISNFAYTDEISSVVDTSFTLLFLSHIRLQ